MRHVSITSLLIVAAFAAACSRPPAPPVERPVQSTPTTAAPVSAVPSSSPLPTALPTPKNGNYPGKGKVVKIDLANGSVELDHEEIKDVMPAMTMEFIVRDKDSLKALTVGDQVDFILEYKDGRETLTRISKAR